MHALICDGVRTPIGRHGGVLAGVRVDDLAATPLRALRDRLPGVDWSALDEIALGCVNQAGEDNRNVARMAGLLAGLPVSAAALTVNRLCGSGLEALAHAARCIASREASLLIAGGVEGMSRAPYVLSKAGGAFARDQQLHDTTIGWRFVHPQLAREHGAEAMGETAENVAAAFGISRVDQDAFALRSQQRALQAQASGRLAREIVPVEVPSRKGESRSVAIDEHPRSSSLESLAALPVAFRAGGTVTAGNAAGINDGACALLVADEAAVARFGLRPRARIVATAVVGVEPRMMGIGPVPAVRRLLARTGLAIGDIDVIELNEAFAAQALAVLRELGLPDDAGHVNPNGGAIALGHPLGMSGARLVLTAVTELELRRERRAICTMCIGVGQGIAMLLERIA
jgi:3-oxoadipyl-CoA thiolase